MPIAESLTTDRWVRVVILAAGYSLTGIVGLSLAIPPGYATAVWPPSGIALAAILMWGPRVWPGIAIGSILVNFGVAFTTATTGFTLLSFVIALSIAAGSTVQALACAGAVERWVGVNKLFETGPATLAFTGIAVVCCLIASSLGRRDPECRGRGRGLGFPFQSWQTWWLGDLIGVIVFAPVFLTWRQSLQIGRKPWRIGESIASFALLAVTTAIVFAAPPPGAGRGNSTDLPALACARLDCVPVPAGRRRARRVPPVRDRDRRDRERHRSVRRRQDERVAADAAGLRRPDGGDGTRDRSGGHGPPAIRA